MKKYKEEIFNEIRTSSLKFSFHESNKRLSGKSKKAVHSIQRVLSLMFYSPFSLI